MRLQKGKFGAGAFTLIELLCVIAIIGILAALLLPAITKGKLPAKQIQCLNQLRQIGVGFHAFAHDHSGKFPMSVSSSDGGSMEFAQNAYEVEGAFYFGFRHFQALSNQIVLPRLLICPMDKRAPAQSFEELKNENVSYFISLSSQLDEPMSLLAGDGNIATEAGAEDGTMIRVGSGQRVRWTGDLHQFRGNLLFTDGHVERRKNSSFTPGREVAGGPTVDLVRPSVQPAYGSRKPSQQPARETKHAAAPVSAAPAEEQSGNEASNDTRVATHSRSAIGEIPASPVRVDGRRETSSIKASNEVPISRSAGSEEAGFGKAANEGWFGLWLEEVLEPLMREAVLALYFLLAILIFAVLSVRRYFSARPGRIRITGFDE